MTCSEVEVLKSSIDREYLSKCIKIVVAGGRFHTKAVDLYDCGSIAIKEYRVRNEMQDFSDTETSEESASPWL